MALDGGPREGTDRAASASEEPGATDTPAASASAVNESAEENNSEKQPTLIQQLLAFFRLLVYSEPTWVDILLLVVGTLAAAAAGTPFPLMSIFFGELVDAMNGATCAADGTGTGSSYSSSINHKVLIVVYIAIAALVLIYAYVLCWSVFSQRLAQRLRDRYLHALLRQEPAFFDTRRAGEVSARLHADVQAVQTGASEKAGIVIASVSFFVTAYVVGFVKEPRLAGMLVSLVPAFLLMALLGGALDQRAAAAAATAAAAASSVASEALEHVGVVQAFGAAPRLEKRFAGHMAVARRAGVKKAVVAAVQAGCLYFVAYSANALAYWQGSKMIAHAASGGDGATVGRVYTVVYILVDACVVLGNISPLLPLLSGASSAFLRLKADIERPSAIDGTSALGAPLPYTAAPSVEFTSVSFAYPTRPAPVLRDLTLSIRPGTHTAIVGPSGGGKSTLASLVARLHLPSGGRLSVGGRYAAALSVRSLRSYVGLVPQDPALLDRSVLENIALGLASSADPAHAPLRPLVLSGALAELAAAGRGIPALAAAHPDAGLRELVRLVVAAAERADARGFAEGLEEGFGTRVGAGGALLSGGQRQRVALARALIRNPRVLVLDEATSAVDAGSEARILAELGRLEGVTVISVAHRLSAVRGADRVVVMQDGTVVEDGGYEELVERGGVFARMVALQSGQSGGGGGPASPAEGSCGSSSRSSVAADVAAKKESDTAVTAVERSAVGDAPGEEETGAGDAEDGGQDRKLPLGATLAGLARLVRPSLIWLAPAVMAGAIVGATFSGAGLLFGHTVSALNPCAHTPHQILTSGKFYSGLLFMLAVVELAANFGAWSSFGLIAERLLYRLRVLSFRSLLEQPLDWHQSDGRSASGLLGVITKDSAAVGGFSGSIIGTVFSIIVNFLVAIVLSHIVAWKIALVCLVVVPILIGSGIMQLLMLSRYEERHAKAFSEATNIAVEAVNAIQTVAALSLEDEILGAHGRVLAAARKEVLLHCALANIWLALANSVGFMIYAFAYWWGAKLIIKGEYSQTDFFVVLMAMLVSAQLWGQMFSLAPEFSRARAAASRIINVVGLGPSSRLGPRAEQTDGSDAGTPARASEKDVEAVAEARRQPLSGSGGARVTFDNVSFAYAARPDVPVLQGVSFTIQPGQFCGLIGPSGAGKSTIMKLVQGIYAATSGTVAIDGMDLSRQETGSFRDEISIVPQDSALFDGSVGFNVGLGARPGHEATDAEIQEACKLANIHETIMALPGRYDAECGPRASKLSGGQRQRLAIARALVRKPRLLLLDESTSALDAESERVLQESLETVAQKVTVIAITHRLHTVRKADVIFMVDGGRIADRGSHAELMERSESYRANVHQQMLQ